MALHIFKDELSHTAVQALLNTGETAIYPLAGTWYTQAFGGTEVPLGLTTTQINLIANALQPGDNVSELLNDSDFQSGTQVSSAITAAVNALVNGAPGALDQLNELATAMGNDPNFATTITNSLALKADKSIQINPVAGETTGGGDLSANRTIGLANVGTPGSSSSASQTLDITVDSKGRISSYARTAIAITSTQVTDFANAVRNTILTGIVFTSTALVTAADSVLVAIGKLQAQLNDIYVDGFNLAAGIATNLAGFQTFVNHNFTLPSDGDYILTVMGGGSINATDNDIATQITVTNDGNTIGPVKMAQGETKDSAGTGPTFSAVEGGTINVGTDQVLPFCYQQRYNGQIAGTFNVLLEFAQGGFDGNDEAAIHHCSIKIEKVKA